MMICLRPAVLSDQPAILSLVRSERLNPTGIDWPHFTVAVGEDGAVVGAVQLRCHADGSRELASFVVAGDARGVGIGARLIDVLLKRALNPVHMITARQYADHYRRWGFRPIGPAHAPRAVRINYRMGRLARVISFFKGRPPQDLVILERASSVISHEPPKRVRRRAGAVA